MALRSRSAVFLREAVALAKHGMLLHRVSPALREVAPAPHLTVFVHGYMASGGVFGPLAEHLASRGIAPRQLHFTYLPTGSVAQHALRLDALIREAHPEGPVHIVGHSMGGLIARYYLQVLGRRLDRLVCLATPHKGTVRAERWSSLPLTREITPSSPTLRLLDATADRLAGVRVCSIVAEADTLVAPVESAALEGHEVVRLPGVAHLSVLFDKTAWDHVARVLAEPVVGTREDAA
jgi:triacylglycerol esterase/lipase EstA (alpha/beta hydrolase family)